MYRIFIMATFKIIFILLFLSNIITLKKKKKIGIVGVRNHNNIGNNLVKFAIYTKLKELGFEPIIIGYTNKGQDISFLKNHVRLKEIKNTFSELREKDYDILMVNSDQTWNGEKNYPEKLLNYGFLRFAENWTVPRFVYGASLGVDYWKYSKSFDVIASNLLKKFSGISVREKGAIKIVKKQLGFKPELVLDPTLLIDKEKYLDLIQDFKVNFNPNEKYICVYQLDNNTLIKNLISDAIHNFNYKIYMVNRYKKKYVENFIICINNSNAVITDSYHGTLFSIIFKKPFISYLNVIRGNDRFISLIETFNLSKRIIFPKDFKKVSINLLQTPLNINQSLINNLKDHSISYLKKNLDLKNMI